MRRVEVMHVVVTQSAKLTLLMIYGHSDWCILTRGDDNVLSWIFCSPWRIAGRRFARGDLVDKVQTMIMHT
jgi:hypothetical protein